MQNKFHNSIKIVKADGHIPNYKNILWWSQTGQKGELSSSYSQR